MSYYTPYTNMDANHYVCFGVYSDCIIYGMPHYILTGIRAHTTLNALMICKSALIFECLITRITIIRALTTVYASMFYKTALFNEWFIT
jgi:hypothetical protein